MKTKKLITVLLLVLITSMAYGASLRPAYFGDGVNKGAAGHDVRAYGATGDGVTDDAAAIQAAADAVAVVGGVVFLPPATYAIESGITIAAGVHVEMVGATLLYTGTAEETALTIGEPGVNNRHVSLMGLSVERDTYSDWSNNANIGISIINAVGCDINIALAAGFTIGVKCLGHGKGWVHNNTQLGRILYNKYGLMLSNDTYAGAYGWCNDNRFYGGHFSTYSGQSTTIDCHAVWITSDDGGYTANNSNAFFGMGIELSARTGGAYSYGVLLTHGNSNDFHSLRIEGVDYIYKSENDSARNVFWLIRDIDDDFVEDGDKHSNIIFHRDKVEERPPRAIFLSGPLYKKAAYYDGDTNVNVPNVFLAKNDAVTYSNMDNIDITDEYLQFTTRGVGIFVNTENAKKFLVTRDAVAGNGGRLYVRCYDSDGALLDGSGVTTYLYSRRASTAMSWSVNYGGAYISGVDSDVAVRFEVTSDVKTIGIICTSGTNPLKIRSFAIYELDAARSYAAACFTGYEEIVPGVNIGTTSPTAGKYEVGRLVYNATPSEWAVIGWQCVSRVDSQMRVGAVATDTTMEIDATAGMTAGDIVGVVQDDGTTHWTTVASITDGDTLELTVGLTDDAAIDNDVYTYRFVAFGSVGTPSATQVIDAVGDAILANATTIVLNPDADYVLTSTPTIADGTTGQVLYITCANNEAHTVTIQDQDTLASSHLQLLASTQVVTGKKVLLLQFDGTDWVQLTGLTDADYGDVTISGGVWSVEDDSHSHTGATLSGIDISADTNLAAGSGITLTGDTLSTNIPGGYYREYDDKWQYKGVGAAADRYTLQSPAGLLLDIDGTMYRIVAQTDYVLSAAATWDTQVGTDYTVAANRAGVDFYIYAIQPASGTVPLIEVSDNSSAPDGYTTANSRKVGGFHCLCVAVGTIGGHPLTDFVAGDILPDSVWDYDHRPMASPEGMVYSEAANIWVDIYLASGTGATTASVYGATITDTRNWMDFTDDGAAVKKRLLWDGEFQKIAAGSNEETNIAGGADPGTTGGHSDTVGRRMISNIGVEDGCGVMRQWLQDQSYRYDAGNHTHSVTVTYKASATGSPVYKDQAETNFNGVTGSGADETVNTSSVDPDPAWAHQNLAGAKGSLYRQGTYGDVKLRAGADWNDGTDSGSRARYADGYRWSANAAIGGRFASEPR